jgi:hypothetical protein
MRSRARIRTIRGGWTRVQWSPLHAARCTLHESPESPWPTFIMIDPGFGVGSVNLVKVTGIYSELGRR